MTIILFIVAFTLLILVHELGHFLAAKKSGIRVDEFGLGLPPKAVSWKKKGSETEYSLNWLPFGGFVRIFGEEYEATDTDEPEYARSFVAQSKLTQVGVLGAGVFFNVLFAWILIAGSLMIGALAPVTPENAEMIENPALTITQVLPDSPAAEAELLPGDRIVRVRTDVEEVVGLIEPEDAQRIIAGAADAVFVTYERGEAVQTIAVTPVPGLVEDVQAIGISFDLLGIERLPIHTALWEGGKQTIALTGTIAVELTKFIGSAFSGGAEFSQLVGPVGIAGIYGDAGALGFGYIMFFTALISIHLAIINFLPFPALDGGRILFVIIEAIKGSPVRPKLFYALNTIGFVLLILLMVVVTYNDIVRLVTG